MTKRDLSHCFIEIYAGCGGNILGFLQAGLKCLAAVEWAPEACLTMWSNLCMEGFSNFKVEPGPNVEKLQKRFSEETYSTENWLFDEIPDDDWIQSEAVSPILNLYCFSTLTMEPEALMADIGIKPGEIGIVSGGFPCQGFSTSNSGRHMDDPRNQHPFRFLHFVDVIRPMVFEGENVPGIITLGKKKDEKEGPFIKWMREKCEEIGYVFGYKTLNALHYGVPQHRRRVIFQGIRKDLWDKGKRHAWPEPTHTWSLYKSKNVMSPETEDEFIELWKSDKESTVNVFEAIGDLTRWHLSAYYDRDCKHLPEGAPERRGGGWDRKTDQQHHSEIRSDGYVWYMDRFTEKWFKGNHCSEYGSHPEKYHNMLYNHCTSCHKFNYVFRKKCHYCRIELMQPDEEHLRYIYNLVITEEKLKEKNANNKKL